MPQATMIAAGLTLAAVILPVTAFAQLLVGVLIGRSIGVFPAALLGAVMTWLLVDFLWTRFEGGHVTAATLAACLLVIGLKALIRGIRREDTEPASALAAEAIAIALLGTTLYLGGYGLRLYS